MKQLFGYHLYAMSSAEVSELISPGVTVLPESWYVATCTDADQTLRIIGGPYDSESHTLFEARAMTDTSGT